MALLTTSLYANSVTRYQIQPNETVLDILENNHIPPAVYFNLPQRDKEILDDIQSNYQVFILKDENNNTTQMLLQTGPRIQFSIKRDAQTGFKTSFIPIEFEKKTKVLHNSIRTSSFTAITQIDPELDDLAEEFRAVFYDSINFNKDVRKGDNLYIVYEETFRLSRKVKPPRILAAMMETNKNPNYVYYYNDQYYTQNGTALQDFSLMAPVKAGVSSRFSLGRPHPILHITRPHHGVDYRARKGQSIKAAMDGKVTFRGWKGGYGNTVIIQHNRQYKTLYAHLDRFSPKLSLNTRVSAGESIGVVGKTGLATGYHLHFGLYSQGEPINPEKFIDKDDAFLRGEDLDSFKKYASAYRSKMKNIYSSTAEVHLP